VGLTSVCYWLLSFKGFQLKHVSVNNIIFLQYRCSENRLCLVALILAGEADNAVWSSQRHTPDGRRLYRLCDVGWRRISLKERGQAVWENINDPCIVAEGRVFLEKGRNIFPTTKGNTMGLFDTFSASWRIVNCIFCLFADYQWAAIFKLKGHQFCYLWDLYRKATIGLLAQIFNDTNNYYNDLCTVDFGLLGSNAVWTCR
jgi:hypothetical protein